MRSPLVVLAFAAVFLMPTFQWMTGVLPDSPLDEKRLAAPEPVWSQAGDLTEYLLGWQTWFNDRYPGRNLLIRAQTQIDFSLFAYSSQVHIGRNGWLFYRSVLDVQKPAFETLPEEELEAAVRNVRQLRDYLVDQGVFPLFLDNQLKDEFYGEMLPWSAPRRTSESQYHRSRRLEEELGQHYLDPTPILKNVAERRAIFHRTDFHWNDPAAFEVARRIVDILATEAGPPVQGWRWELEIETEVFAGGQSSFLPLFWPATEEGLFVKPSWPSRDVRHGFNEGPFEYVYAVAEPQPGDLPRTVVFGDSFFDGILRSGFAEHFAALHRARPNAVPLEEVVATLPEGTRFVVIQAIEAGIAEWYRGNREWNIGS